LPRPALGPAGSVGKRHAHFVGRSLGLASRQGVRRKARMAMATISTASRAREIVGAIGED
jgi:hypothetical protein